jgi:hypothetical protein
MRDVLLQYGAETVIVDGAFGRKTIASTVVTENTILCAGAALNRDMRQVVAETLHVYKLLKSEQIDDELAAATEKLSLAVVMENGDVAGYERVALTNAFINELLGKHVKNAMIIVQDASKLLIDMRSHERLERSNIKLMVRDSIRLLAVAVNPHSPYGYEFEAEEFKKAIEGSVETPVVDVVKDSRSFYELLGTK